MEPKRQRPTTSKSSLRGEFKVIRGRDVEEWDFSFPHTDQGGVALRVGIGIVEDLPAHAATA